MKQEIYLETGSLATTAQYHESGITEYDTNPYIQALPPIATQANIIEYLFQKPQYTEKECLLDPVIRTHLIQRLYNLFQPLPTHVRIWNMITTLIRQGYIARNPFSPEYIRFLHEKGRAVMNKRNVETSTQFKTTAGTGTLIGFSGMGKTTMVNKVLSNIPQIIIHNQYKGTEFIQIQLTWLKLEAPHNASLKALCLQFFMKLDKILGTNNFKQYVSRNLSVDAMLPLMGQASQNVGLGLLVIDELQHLVGRHMNQTMSYFVTLINSFGVPVLFIGTPAAYPIFQSELRMARRITGMGEIIWNNMDNDDEFKLLLERLWSYQWLKQKSELTVEMIDVFYEETQGITDLIVKLFINVQEEAILSGKEVITVALVRKVARQCFRALKQMLEAIKSKNPYKIAKYEDIQRLEAKHEVADTTIRKVEKNKKQIVAKVEEDNRIEQTKNIKKVKGDKATYDQGDIRFILTSLNKNTKEAHEALIENDYIDNMKEWVFAND